MTKITASMKLKTLTAAIALSMVATAALLIGTVTPCMADPAEMDEWCSTDAHLPSSIAICSDPVLRELAVQRNHAFGDGARPSER